MKKLKKKLKMLVGIDTSSAISCSGKTGEGVDDILEAIINILPPPKGEAIRKIKITIS